MGNARLSFYILLQIPTRPDFPLSARRLFPILHCQRPIEADIRCQDTPVPPRQVWLGRHSPSYMSGAIGHSLL